MAKLYKYTPEDFGKLSIKVLHMDLDFDIYNAHTDVTSRLKAKALQSLKELQLNAKNLEIHAVSCDACAITHHYQEKEDMLTIIFGREIKKNETFTITTKTTCKPTKNVLEGLYYDETPENCPPTQITQCQQWGFQRIAPCIDDMTAKCTYITTITADDRYTNIITNGDLIQDRKKTGKGRVQVKYDNTKTPMAPYLFFLGVGTYATYKRPFQYPDGTRFTLELLVPPSADKERAEKALEIMFNGILWIHLFTGPETYKYFEIKKQIWDLTWDRERLLKKTQDESTREAVTAINNKIRQLAAPLTFGYQYTGTVYREIGMQNSDFGGMENVGNTTITTNRIMPFAEMTDRAFAYLIAVKTHEFYHNINGSEVTGWSPFEIWLNEAVTVFIEHMHTAFVFGKDYARLSNVLDILSPDGGTLQQDAGAASMPIEPDGFNDPNELITSITYVKAPEFVRMIETLMGKEAFVKALHNYHTQYAHSNATREQWIQCMEKESGMLFTSMAQVWLKKTKYPEITVTTKNEQGKFNVSIIQNGEWQFPFVIALHDSNGNILEEKTIFIKEKETVLSFKEKPAFMSLSKEYSFYGKVHYKASKEELLLQVRKGKDVVCRFLAFHQLMDQEKTRLLKNPEAKPDIILIELYHELFTDQQLMQHVGPQILSIFESVEDEIYAHSYQEVYDVRKKFMTAIAQKYQKEVHIIHAAYKEKKFVGDYLEKSVKEIKNREIKNVALGLLSYLETPEVHALIKQQFEQASSATDKVLAFRLYLNSKAQDRFELMKNYQKEAVKSLVSWETFLLVVGSNDNNNFIDIIKEVEQSSSFRIEQANDQRALYSSFAGNKKKSLLTEKGRNYLKECILKLAHINEHSTLYLLKTFGNLDKMESQHHVPLMQILVDVLNTVDPDKAPSVYNTTKRMITNLPLAKKAYEKEKGKILF